jgi:hypothetical protein
MPLLALLVDCCAPRRSFPLPDSLEVTKAGLTLKTSLLHLVAMRPFKMQNEFAPIADLCCIADYPAPR